MPKIRICIQGDSKEKCLELLDRFDMDTTDLICEKQCCYDGVNTILEVLIDITYISKKEPHDFFASKK